MYVWTAVALTIGVIAVVLGWHSQGGTTDPTTLPPGHRLSHATVVINSAILVFREGLETILVLAAVTASFRGGNRVYRKPVAAGGGLAVLAGIGTWFAVVWLIGRFHGSELDIEAATGLPSLIVLLLVMNWFFHKVYWTNWISHHHKRRRGLLAGGEGSLRAMTLGFLLLGFTSVYRESFEVVIFLQNLRELYGSSVVFEGVTLGAMFTAAVGVLTFTLHQKLPYKRLLIITGVMLLLVLLVSVGEEVQEMQLAGWIGTTNVPGLSFPGWMGTWFSLFGNWQTIAAQVLAFVIVVGSYVAAQYLRVWRPRRRGQSVAVAAEAPPERAADLATAPRRRGGARAASVG
jgi:high-affinity iron transporter